MPLNFIPITTNGLRLAGNLQSTADGLAQFFGRLEQIKSDMDNMTDGISFATLEGQFGIPTGKGETVYNLVAGAYADLGASSNFTGLLNWLATLR